ncbi:hypothetical protein M8C21_031100, partial [Ambrosia artemisiifolia]
MNSRIDDHTVKENVKENEVEDDEGLTLYSYHYNVTDARLRQHVEKGNEDGLYISCVASGSNLWALIMDARTGFGSQVYEVSPVFLHKEWIMEQWEKNFYISSIVGTTNGSSLVVMSKVREFKRG